MKHAKIIFLSIISLFFAGNMNAQEHFMYGTVVLSLTDTFSPASETHNLSAASRIDINHELTCEDTGLYVHHRLEKTGDEAPSYTLYEAFVKHALNNVLVIYSGKHRLNWGTGYIMVPSDALHPAEGMWSWEQQTGYLGASLHYTPIHWFSLKTIISIDEAVKLENRTAEIIMEDITGGLYATMLAGPVDMFVSGLYRHEDVLLTGAGASIDLADVIINIETAFDFYNTAVYPDSTSSWGSAKKYKPFAAITAGAERSVTIKGVTATIVAEYLYDQAGYVADEVSSFFDAALIGTPLPGNAPRLSQHYGSMTLGFDYAFVFSIEASALVNLSDLSGAGGAQASYEFDTGVDAGISAAWNWGPERSEFGLPGESLETTISVVFHF